MFVPNKIRENPHLWETELTPQRRVAKVVCSIAHSDGLLICVQSSGDKNTWDSRSCVSFLSRPVTVMAHGYVCLGDSRALPQCSFLPFLSCGMHGCLNQKPTNVCRTPVFISAGDCSFASQSGLTSSNLHPPDCHHTKKVPNR